jgi:hypothetical protein
VDSDSSLDHGPNPPLAADPVPGWPNLQHYLLLAPLREAPDAVSLTPDTIPDSPSSRKTSAAEVLRHSWCSIEPDTEPSTTGPVSTVEVTKAAVASVRGQHVAALEVTRRTTLAERPEDAEEIEVELSTSATRFLVGRLGIAESAVLWVGRYSLDQQQPEQWTSHGTITETLHTGHGQTDQQPELHIGWGNGVVLGWSHLPNDDQTQLVRGLVDAQCIWADCYSIAGQALASIRTLQEPSDRLVTGTQLKTLQRSTEALSAKLVDHHLALDDLLLNIQGTRSQVARAALRAWGYHDASARVDRRVADVLQLLQLRRERFDRRFQSTVEFVLFAIGLLTLIEFPLAIISTSFTGPVSISPGTGSPLGIFAWIRATNVDALLLAAVALAVTAAFIVEKRRRS